MNREERLLRLAKVFPVPDTSLPTLSRPDRRFGIVASTMANKDRPSEQWVAHFIDNTGNTKITHTIKELEGMARGSDRQIMAAHGVTVREIQRAMDYLEGVRTFVGLEPNPRKSRDSVAVFENAAGERKPYTLDDLAHFANMDRKTLVKVHGLSEAVISDAVGAFIAEDTARAKAGHTADAPLSEPMPL